MHIQWFPGHMTKALREMESHMKKIDVVLYLLDARAIASSFNHKFDNIISNKKVLYVVNKCDLVLKEDLAKWKQYFQKESKSAIFVQSNSSKDKKAILNGVFLVAQEIINKYKNKGVNKIIRAMVIGMPNTGKSSLINILAPQKKAVTGNKAGVTRGIQFVRVNDYCELYDTPGTLVPAFENQEIARKLAFIGCISDDVLDINELAIELIKYFKSIDSKLFLERFKQDEYLEDSYEQLQAIAKARGYIMSQNRVDIDRVSKAMVVEFRSAKLGREMLDKVEE